MDANRFDGFVQSFATNRSRRGVFRAIAAGALGAPVLASRGATAGPVAVCIPNGKKCSTASPELCCSGICKKKKGKAKCQKAFSAFGCTNVQDSCNGPDIPCPKRAATGLCFVDANHVPFCADADFDFTCMDCSDDAPCINRFGDGAFCLACPDCVPFSTNTGCIRPVKVKTSG